MRGVVAASPRKRGRKGSSGRPRTATELKEGIWDIIRFTIVTSSPPSALRTGRCQSHDRLGRLTSMTRTGGLRVKMVFVCIFPVGKPRL